MLKKLQAFFTSSHQTENETALNRRWLRIVLALSLLVIGGYIFVVAWAGWQTIELFFAIGLFTFYGALFILAQRKQTTLANNLFTFSTLAALMLASYLFGGVRSPSYVSLLTCIVLAAIFMRARMAIVCAVIIAVYGLILAYAEETGLYHPVTERLGPINFWLSHSFTILSLAVLMGLASKNVRTLFTRTFQEMQERRRAASTLRQQAEYLNVLHNTTLSIMNRLELMPILDSILTEAGRLCDTPHGYIDLILPNTKGTHQVLGHGIYAETPNPDGETSENQPARTVENYKNWENLKSEIASKGQHAIITLPLLAQNQVLGVLGLAYTDQRQFTPEQETILEQYSKLAALGIYNAKLYEDAQADLSERKRAEMALLESQQRLELALESANMGFWDWNILTNEMIWSDQLYEIFEVHRDEFDENSESYFSLIHPSDQAMVRKSIDESIQSSKTSYRVEHRIFTPEGGIRWIENRGKIMRGNSGQAIRVISSVIDITERKLHETAIRKANKTLEHSAHILTRRSALLQLGAEVARAATAILDSQKLGQQVVNLVQKSFDLYYAGLYLVSKDGKWAELQAATGAAGRDMLEQNWRLPVGNTSMIGWCIFNRESRIALDVGEEAVRFNNPLLPNTRSELALPLVSRDQVLGALTIQSELQSAFSKEDISTLETMADLLANAILNARLYDQLQQELEERKKIEDEIRQLNAELEARVQRRTEALQASEEQFRALTENNPVRIRRFDAQARYLYANHTGEDDDVASKDVIGKRIRDVMTDPELINLSEAYIQQVFETGKPLNTEYRYGENYASWWLAPEFGPDGKVVSVVTSAIDITERKQIEEALEQKTQELQAANRELEAFSYSVSHDLRAPLRAIDGFSRILLDEYTSELPEGAGLYLKRVRNAAQEMARLIEDMLRLSRVTRIELRFDEVNLSELMQDIADELSQREPDRDVKIEIAPDMLVQGDQGLLRMAVENLMSNAWKFTGKVSQAEIQVGSQSHDGQTIFYVKDNGAGFDMQFASKLFGAFQRLHKADDFPGTGIGLAIVQRVINKHGGKIWAESEPGKGATFYFTLG